MAKGRVRPPSPASPLRVPDRPVERALDPGPGPRRRSSKRTRIESTGSTSPSSGGAGCAGAGADGASACTDAAAGQTGFGRSSSLRRQLEQAAHGRRVLAPPRGGRSRPARSWRARAHGRPRSRPARCPPASRCAPGSRVSRRGRTPWSGPYSTLKDVVRPVVLSPTTMLGRRIWSGRSPASLAQRHLGLELRPLVRVAEALAHGELVLPEQPARLAGHVRGRDVGEPLERRAGARELGHAARCRPRSRGATPRGGGRTTPRRRSARRSRPRRAGAPPSPRTGQGRSARCRRPPRSDARGRAAARQHLCRYRRARARRHPGRHARGNATAPLVPRIPWRR